MRAIFEKLIVSWLVEKFPISVEARAFRFFSHMLATGLHTESDLPVGLPSDPVPLGFLTKLCVCVCSPYVLHVSLIRSWACLVRGSNVQNYKTSVKYENTQPSSKRQVKDDVTAVQEIRKHKFAIKS